MERKNVQLMAINVKKKDEREAQCKTLFKICIYIISNNLISNNLKPKSRPLP